MQYIRVAWKHEHPDEPTMLYSEVDKDRWEVRKVEVFRDGTLGYASAERSSASTGLGLERVPPLAQIARDPQFEPADITKERIRTDLAESPYAQIATVRP